MLIRGRKTIYLGIIAVVLIALVVDRVLLSDGLTTPQHAEGALDPSVSGKNCPLDCTCLSCQTGRPGSAEAATTTWLPELRFPRLTPLAAHHLPTRDMFEVPEAMRHVEDNHPVTELPSGTADVQPRGESRTAADFAAAYRPEAILMQGRNSIVIVEGRWLRVGMALDGCTLIGVEGNRAAFACPDGVVVLRPPIPELPGSESH